MEKVTMMRRQGEGWTLRPTEMSELIECVKNGKYAEPVNFLRQVFPLFTFRRNADGSINNPQADKIGRVCFAAEWVRRGNTSRMQKYNGLALLEVNNLKDTEEAMAVRAGAARMPQTMLAFVGISGRSVKIVCRGELFPDRRKGTAARLPIDEEEIRRFHVNLYEQARMAYNAQLGVTIEKLQPALNRACYISVDPKIVFNPYALPFYVDSSELKVPVSSDSWQQPSNYANDLLVPGRNEHETWQLVFQLNMQRACEETFDEDDSNERPYHTLMLLAQYCLETGVPMAMARDLSTYSWVGHDRELATAVFNTVYNEKAMRQYREKKKITHPLKTMASEALLTMKIDLFLMQNYEMRKNVMKGIAEFRERDAFGFGFRDLTEEARNSITMKALRQGIRCWDKDIRRFVNSEDIRPYSPLGDFLEHLPQWDGRDRVKPLAQRIKTSYKEWPFLFHIWMRSMVAMWQGKGQLTGNALVPLLIGRQGCGKSSFCRILLPRDLREYYNDRINFKNEADLNLGLTSFALLNLDEFDKITQRQQIVLKYLVSTADLKYRPPYGKAYSAHRRYASFIGTTNEPNPLTDPSGSRRFVCVTVEDDIDFTTPIDYDQLYAQLKQEIEDGERYWLETEETAALMQHNRPYQRINGLAEMLYAVIEQPVRNSDGSWMMLSEISDLLRLRFGSDYNPSKGTLERIGSLLNRPDYKFEGRHLRSGMAYFVKVRK